MGYGISINNKELFSHFIYLGGKRIGKTPSDGLVVINIPEKYHIHLNPNYFNKATTVKERAELLKKYGKGIEYKDWVPVISIVPTVLPRALAYGYVVRWGSSKDKNVLDIIEYRNETNSIIEFIYGVAYVKYKGIEL